MTLVTTRSAIQSSKKRSLLRTEPACYLTAQDWAWSSTHWPFAVSARPRSYGATPWVRKFTFKRDAPLASKWFSRQDAHGSQAAPQFALNFFASRPHRVR